MRRVTVHYHIMGLLKSFGIDRVAIASKRDYYTILLGFPIGASWKGGGW